MTVGEKIKKYRILSGMTQKELGMRIGFSEQTAVSRIGKYEKDLMKPKKEIRQKIADVLEVDLIALNSVASQSEDIMQVILALDEIYDIQIRQEGKYIFLIFEEEKCEKALIDRIQFWKQEKRNFLSEKDSEHFILYEKWKGRFESIFRSRGRKEDCMN